MNKLIIFILTLLPVFSYSQVTSINIDTSASQVIIINNGTMIQNNGGTVNVNTYNESSEEIGSSPKTNIERNEINRRPSKKIPYFGNDPFHVSNKSNKVPPNITIIAIFTDILIIMLIIMYSPDEFKELCGGFLILMSILLIPLITGYILILIYG